MLLGFLVFFPMLASLVSYLIGRHSKRLRDGFVILSCLLELLGALLSVLAVIRGMTLSLTIPGFCLMGLHFELDGFRALYALVGGVMWLATSMLGSEYFAHHYHNRNRYNLFFLMTLGATVGVFLSADLFTTFVFFEIMSFTSYTWVAHDETPGALRAAETYLAVAVIGGVAGWYFKIYRPKKQQAADTAEDYGDDYDDTSPWEDEEETESEGEK